MVIVISRFFFAFIILKLMMFSSCSRDSQEEKQAMDSLTIEYTPAVLIDQLPQVIPETSGMAEFDGLFWTINDSGGMNVLYGFDKQSGEIKRAVEITNALNYDWESLASDASFFYIGDVGNNDGMRNDLVIYKVSKTQLLQGSINATAEKISFSWSDQKYFVNARNANPYDCEAILSFGDSLILFAKDWVTENTRMYVLPKTPGNYVARLTASFAASGLITGADISPDGKVLVLSGYHDYSPFLWLMWGFDDKNFFESEKLRVEYPDFFSAQTEGVLFSGNDSIIVSAARTRDLPQRLYYFSLKELLSAAERE